MNNTRPPLNTSRCAPGATHYRRRHHGRHLAPLARIFISLYYPWFCRGTRKRIPRATRANTTALDLIQNEETLEDALRWFPMPVVNQALSSMPGAPHYGRGTRCITAQFKPDWSVVLESKVEGNGRYVNLLPGDTKLSSKWTPRMIEDGATSTNGRRLSPKWCLTQQGSLSTTDSLSQIPWS